MGFYKLKCWEGVIKGVGLEPSVSKDEICPASEKGMKSVYKTGFDLANGTRLGENGIK